MSTALTGTSLRSNQQLKRCTQGLSVHVLHYANALGADTEETGRYDLRERFPV